MASRLGPIHVCCDSPSYSVVGATRWLGMTSPEDVRWLRMSNYLEHDATTFDGHAWALYLEMGGACRKKCTCGKQLPILERCTFTFRDGTQADYLMGQCVQCRTIYWEEA